MADAAYYLIRHVIVDISACLGRAVLHTTRERYGASLGSGHPLLIAQQRAPKGVILTGVGAGLVGLMDNLLQPLPVGGQARLQVLPCS